MLPRFGAVKPGTLRFVKGICAPYDTSSTKRKSPTSSVGSMLSDGMWYAAIRKMRMKRKIATALASDVSEAREKNGSRGPRDDLAEATTDRFEGAVVVRFLAATARGGEGARSGGRSIFLA